MFSELSFDQRMCDFQHLQILNIDQNYGKVGGRGGEKRKGNRMLISFFRKMIPNIILPTNMIDPVGQEGDRCSDGDLDTHCWCFKNLTFNSAQSGEADTGLGRGIT